MHIHCIGPALLSRAGSKLVCAVTGGERVHVGVATYDTTVHFYSLRADQSAFQMLVMPDSQQPYSPAFHTSLLVPLSQSRDMVRRLGLFTRQQAPWRWRADDIVSFLLTLELL
jgi:protein transport protein SEC24